MNEVAPDQIARFLGEYPAILQGKCGRFAQAIAKDFESWFVLVPKPGTPALRDAAGHLMSPMSSEEDRGIEKGQTEMSSIDGQFQLAKYPVTNSVYQLFNPRHFERRLDYLAHTLPDPLRPDEPHPDCPVQFVDWYDATVFSWWVGGQLPTEHEWEYACRADPVGVPTKWHSGDDEESVKTVAWCGRYKKRVDVVGGQKASRWGSTRRYFAETRLSMRSYIQKEFALFFGQRPSRRSRLLQLSQLPRQTSQPRLPNAYGLYDMHGNVWEWTSTSVHHNPHPMRDDILFLETACVCRGGSFNEEPSQCHTGARAKGGPFFTYEDIGFRVSRRI